MAILVLKPTNYFISSTFLITCKQGIFIFISTNYFYFIHNAFIPLISNHNIFMSLIHNPQTKHGHNVYHSDIIVNH